jgi:hypothetical protein
MKPLPGSGLGGPLATLGVLLLVAGALATVLARGQTGLRPDRSPAIMDFDEPASGPVPSGQSRRQ